MAGQRIELPRLGGTVEVLSYQARYTHRTAIGNERLQAIEGDQVRLRVRMNAASGRPVGKRSITVDGVQFIARLLQHVLPPGFKRIRHYGLLAAAVKTERLTQACELLQMPQPSAQAMEEARAFTSRVTALQIGRCAHCADGRWQVTGSVRPTAWRSHAFHLRPAGTAVNAGRTCRLPASRREPASPRGAGLCPHRPTASWAARHPTDLEVGGAPGLTRRAHSKAPGGTRTRPSVARPSS